VTTEGERKTGRWERALRGYNESQSTILCVATRNDTAVGAHFGRADQGAEMELRSRSRLVERTAVGEGG